MGKIYRLQVAFKDKQSNIALTFHSKTIAQEVCDALQSEAQSDRYKLGMYFDDVGNVLYVKGVSIDYLLLTDLEADLEAMVTIQTMTATAQKEAVKLSDEDTDSCYPSSRGRA